MAARKNWGMRIAALMYGVVAGCLTSGLALWLQPPGEFSHRAIGATVAGIAISAVVGISTYASMRNSRHSDDVNRGGDDVAE